MTNKKKVVLNVGGQRYETLWTTLSKVPFSRLGMLDEDDVEDGEIFFDRNPRLFPYILDYYRTGNLHFPHNICGPSIQQELQFWQLSESAISVCCWKSYKEYDEEQETLNMLSQQLTSVWPTNVSPSYHNHQSGNRAARPSMKQAIWLFLEDPNSSKFAKIWAWIFMSLVILSIAVVCAETHPSFRVQRSPPLAQSSPGQVDFNNTKMKLYIATVPHPILITLDYICTGVFGIELLIKFIVWPGKLNFFTKFFNIIDLLSVVPMVINNLLQVFYPGFWAENNLFFGYCVISVSNVFRAIRILKLVKHHQGLQVMYLAMRASGKEIMLLLLLIAIGTLIFATMIYFAEFTQESDAFPHIPIGFWWSIITMTTVGYGDRVPSSVLGYIVGSACAVTGMLTTGLPIPVIANSFHLYHTYARLKGKLDERKKETEMTNHGIGAGLASITSPHTCQTDTHTPNAKCSKRDTHVIDKQEPMANNDKPNIHRNIKNYKPLSYDSCLSRVLSNSAKHRKTFSLDYELNEAAKCSKVFDSDYKCMVRPTGLGVVSTDDHDNDSDHPTRQLLGPSDGRDTHVDYHNPSGEDPQCNCAIIRENHSFGENSDAQNAQYERSRNDESLDSLGTEKDELLEKDRSDILEMSRTFDGTNCDRNLCGCGRVEHKEDKGMKHSDLCLDRDCNLRETNI